ncbi:MAG: ACP phosphodiesterase [Leptotrichiaceae bacterium]|nr:ACP phosphodiesterase [Leptotrichiaceae bacterium]
MNFLGHSMISLEVDRENNKETLYGNFAGDFYKGLTEKIELPYKLKEGIILHRIIDGISDRKENLLNSLLKEKFGIYKGIVSDMFLDHFLSKNFYRLFNENINDIETEIFYNIKAKESYFPERFGNIFDWIMSERILSKYSDINVLTKVFSGISGRMKNGAILNFAVDEFEKKSIEEFEYVKYSSIKKFLNKI